MVSSGKKACGGLLPLGVAALLSVAAGCCYTHLTKNGADISVRRAAFLYPFDVGALRIETTNATYELSNYQTDGGGSNAAAIAEAAVRGAVEAAKK